MKGDSGQRVAILLRQEPFPYLTFDGTVQVFKALGGTHRLGTPHCLATTDGSGCSTGQDICICDVQETLGLSRPTTNHHMKFLMDAGLIKTEKRGKNPSYTLTEAGSQRLDGEIKCPATPPKQATTVSLGVYTDLWTACRGLHCRARLLRCMAASMT
ncbi:ArsR family transcriptional regulator [Deinococcus humi]|uniref:DNA-binding transcriptional ArsR family regulator n=1 Tax=Deinococcus humi TaxID=662880 RepID=A0A7W8JV08_9DEIO|nr:DNA-binding transcriptional ArsR family regulator [Deinococcus humi]